jgi:O-glycosyl hydrolase
VTSGAGLSILRNRIPFRENRKYDDAFLAKDTSGDYRYSGSSATYKTFQLNWNNWDLVATRDLIRAIKDKGADYDVQKVFSTPWTPPNNAVSRWKLPTTGEHALAEGTYATEPEVGGYLDPAHYQDYADLLADYVKGFQSHMGMPLYALSLQNEPSFRCGYESCDWTPEQFHDFLTVLDTEFRKKGVHGTKIMMPEHNNFQESMALPALRDRTTAAIVDIVAGHQYEVYNDAALASYEPPTFARSHMMGKQVWMTEWNTSAFHARSEIQQALIVGRLIQQSFSVSGANAYVFWWTNSLMNGSRPNKNLWAIGQYSRFVRPGWKLVSVSGNAKTGVWTSAFVNPNHTRLAVVVVNSDSNDVPLNLKLESGVAKSGAVYRTSATEDMVRVSASQTAARDFSLVAKAESITTWVTQLSR